MTSGTYSIDTRGAISGNMKTLCPKCSATRTKTPHDLCLSVNMDTGAFNCHHCGWSGIADEYKAKPYSTAPKLYKIPAYDPDSQMSMPAKTFFSQRRILDATLKRNRVTAGSTIFYPYYRDGKVINIKRRFFQSKENNGKNFRLEKDAELIFYGFDDINDDMTFIVEGEMDKLAMEEAGYLNTIACPSGSLSKNPARPLLYLDSAKERLDRVKKIVLAGDMDTVGEAITGELARRLGVERCARVTWPEGCKDANDVLMKYTAKGIREAVSRMKDYPVAGLYEVDSFRKETETLYNGGLSKGISTGWKTLDPHYTIMPGQWTVITGSPGTGKSEFLDALTINLILKHGWKFGVCSMENLPVEMHLAKLLEKVNRMPFFDGPNIRMREEDLSGGLDILQNHIKFILPESDGFTVRGILKLATIAVKKYGINGLIIDPWNELEHNYHTNETKYIGDSLTKLRRFARQTNVHIWIVAHPTKLQKNNDGEYPVPTLYDIAGSANWYNKADCGISLWRDCADNSVPVQVHVQKIRFQKQVGRPGMEELIYDPITGRYSDIDFNLMNGRG